MAEHLAYKTKKRKKQVIEFSIDDEEYHFTVPKSADMVLPVLQDSVENAGFTSLKAQFEWLGKGLPEAESDRLLARLQAPREEDDFDWDDLEKISEWVMKQVAKRPTT